MKLDIIVPYYKESWETIRFLFDSLRTQRGILFENVRVLFVIDGYRIVDQLDDIDIMQMYAFPFEVEFLEKEHEGVSAARNYGLDHSYADYVMFCDCDDGFLNNYALHTIFAAMQEGFDFLVSNFIEESFDADGNPKIVSHDQDMTFVHGKVYRRKFLVENHLRFDKSMTIHEDGYFNMLVYGVVKNGGQLKKITVPLYIWRWNDESVVRKDREDFTLKTYDDVMLTRTGLCRQLKQRGYETDYETSVCMTVLNSYYDFQKPRYHMAKNAKYLRQAEKAFRGFWMEFRDVFNNCTNQKISEIASVARATAVKKGMLLEQQTLKEFLRYIEYEVKP